MLNVLFFEIASLAKALILVWGHGQLPVSAQALAPILMLLGTCLKNVTPLPRISDKESDPTCQDKPDPDPEKNYTVADPGFMKIVHIHILGRF